MTRQLWWHAFGHVVPEGYDFAGSWYLAVAGDSDRAPDEVVRQIKLGPSNAPYICSWDHEPTDADKNFITPSEHRKTATPSSTPEVD